MQESDENNSETLKQLCVSFGYQCCVDNLYGCSPEKELTNTRKRSSSFSCLSAAAVNANATLANTSIGNGIIGEEILPGLDSPKSFQRMPSSPSLSRLDLAPSTSQRDMSTLDEGLSVGNVSSEAVVRGAGARSSESSSFLNSTCVQMAGGAAGEDRVQAVCSEGREWLFCGVYDGFNGRDAADFLAGTLYETIGFNLEMLERRGQEPSSGSSLVSLDSSEADGSFFHQQVLGCLCHSLAQAEKDFMNMVEEEMEDRPDLVCVGSSVVIVLLRAMHLYILNLGDSRAVVATKDGGDHGCLQAVQLTETHSVDEEKEYNKVLGDHPDDPSPITGGRVKGKLKLTRAFGVGYLKKTKLNDALMGILRVENLSSPPYVDDQPFTKYHGVSEKDEFVIVGSDGLFDFFSNDEVVKLVHRFMREGVGDPAKYLVEQLLSRAANSAGMSREELMRIPAGRRRKYHDDVTVIVIMLLGADKQLRTSTASTTSATA